MRCTIKDWYGKIYEMDLASALAPRADWDGGSVEAATALASKNAECLGKLLEMLVENKIITLYEACSICGLYSNIKLEK